MPPKKRKSKATGKRLAPSPARSISPVSPVKPEVGGENSINQKDSHHGPTTQVLNMYETPKLEPKDEPQDISPLSATQTPESHVSSNFNERKLDRPGTENTQEATPEPKHETPNTLTDTKQGAEHLRKGEMLVNDKLGDNAEKVTAGHDVKPKLSPALSPELNTLPTSPNIKPSQDEVPSEDEFDRLADELDDDEPIIPQRSIARSVEPEGAIMLEATRQPVMMAKPVILNDISVYNKLGEGDFDPDTYFSGPEDEVIRVEQEPEQVPEEDHFDFGDAPTEESTRIEHTKVSSAEHAKDPLQVQSNTHTESSSPPPSATADQTSIIDRVSEVSSKHGMIRRVTTPDLKPHDYTPLQSPVASPSPSSPAKESFKKDSEDNYNGRELDEDDTLAATNAKWRKTYPPTRGEGDKHSKPHPDPLNVSSNMGLNPHKYHSRNLSVDSFSSPYASPRPYKYTQSPLPSISHQNKTDPPIFGVCVVGFHHQRGPEVEYWVGPDRSHSKIWPYLPFQSLPDGSHQFEENICYFTLLYDRNKSASTSLTFSRDENGNIKEGTSDFRNVTTLFAIACSRQLNLSELENVGDDEEYTRTIVQKSVVVIASKPIFGPIKEKLTVVTRSYFQQKNFMDRSIIDHFYENMLQMPMWINENDFQVGMNLQRFVRDFGPQVLVILKAMLLELKILFYANDTDVLGTTQFALISLVPNLISHLEDCGSPLLSSYELGLRTPHTYKHGDRQSLLKYMGLPLQLFAGGGVFAPFVPLQQFDELKQPETRYGLMGTTNNLFLGSEIDFDVVVNIDHTDVQIRNSAVTPLLKLSEADNAFINNITVAVGKAWDTEETWQPEALGYHGGEDYIRHEFEEYLLALLASAKYATTPPPVVVIPTDPATIGPDLSPSRGSLGNTVASTTSVNSIPSTSSTNANATNVPVNSKAKESISHWNKEWAEMWMNTTNNFRIFDQHTSSEIATAIADRSHPGLKHIKPSGFARFLGLFRSKPDPAPSTASTNSHTTPEPSVTHTPTLAPVASFEPQTPRNQTSSQFDM